MVPIEALYPGMRVKIVDKWVPGCGQNKAGRMDKYLGQIVTVIKVRNGCVYIEEDAGSCDFHEGGHWNWYAASFDYIVEDEDFEPASDSEFLSFLYGG